MRAFAAKDVVDEKRLFPLNILLTQKLFATVTH
jgi:hypothetical protein